MLCQFPVYSTMLKSHRNIHTLILIFFTTGYYKILNVVPCALQNKLVVESSLLFSTECTPFVWADQFLYSPPKAHPSCFWGLLF